MRWEKNSPQSGKKRSTHSLSHTHSFSPRMRIPSGTCLLVLAHMKLCKMVALQGALLYGRLFRTHAKVPQCEREGMRLWMEVLKARVEKMRRCKRICIFLLLYAYCIFYSLRSGASADENPRKGEKRRKVSYGIPTTVSSAWHRSSLSHAQSSSFFLLLVELLPFLSFIIYKFVNI